MNVRIITEVGKQPDFPPKMSVDVFFNPSFAQIGGGFGGQLENDKCFNTLINSFLRKIAKVAKLHYFRYLHYFFTRVICLYFPLLSILKSRPITFNSVFLVFKNRERECDALGR